MARDFVLCDRGQVLLMPPSLTDWLPENHLMWMVLGAVRVMDLVAPAARAPKLQVSVPDDVVQEPA